MSWSLGEARALAVKAARGAGLDWGLAEEAGYAIWVLQKSGLPGIQSLANYLCWYHDEADKPVSTINNNCPLIMGTQLSDFSFTGTKTLAKVSHPLLICPFLVSDPLCTSENINPAATEDAKNRAFSKGPHQYAVVFHNTNVIVTSDGIHSDASRESLLAPTATCTITATDRADTTLQRQVSTRVPGTEVNAYRQLEQFASKTYAPATEASRISGAGSGLSDND